MKRLWRSISAIGFSEALSRRDQKRLILINRICAIFVPLFFVRTIVFLLLPQAALALIPGFVVVFSIAILC